MRADACVAPELQPPTKIGYSLRMADVKVVKHPEPVVPEDEVVITLKWSEAERLLAMLTTQEYQSTAVDTLQRRLSAVEVRLPRHQIGGTGQFPPTANQFPITEEAVLLHRARHQ